MNESIQRNQRLKKFGCYLVSMKLDRLLPARETWLPANDLRGFSLRYKGSSICKIKPKK
jgi:hypothetical protein